MFPDKLPSRFFHILRKRLQINQNVHPHVLSYNSDILLYCPSKFQNPHSFVAKIRFIPESQDTSCLCLLPLTPHHNVSPDTVKNTLYYKFYFFNL